MVETFGEDWVSHLSREDSVSLSLFLCFQLTKHLTLGETKAAVLAGMMVGKSDKPFESGGKSSLRMMALSLQRSRADMNGCLVK